MKAAIAALMILFCTACANVPRVWCADANVQAAVPVVECLAPEA